MKTKLFVFLFACMATVFGVSAQNSDVVVGTWKLIESNGNAIPKEYKQLKFITPTHFIWTLTDEEGNIISGASGKYKINKDEYTEEILMVLPGMKNFQNKKAVYKIEINGKKMKITGLLDNVIKNMEIWENID